MTFGAHVLHHGLVRRTVVLRRRGVSGASPPPGSLAGLDTEDDRLDEVCLGGKGEDDVEDDNGSKLEVERAGQLDEAQLVEDVARRYKEEVRREDREAGQ